MRDSRYNRPSAWVSSCREESYSFDPPSHIERLRRILVLFPPLNSHTERTLYLYDKHCPKYDLSKVSTSNSASHCHAFSLSLILTYPNSDNRVIIPPKVYSFSPSSCKPEKQGQRGNRDQKSASYDLAIYQPEWVNRVYFHHNALFCSVTPLFVRFARYSWVFWKISAEKINGEKAWLCFFFSRGRASRTLDLSVYAYFSQPY